MARPSLVRRKPLALANYCHECCAKSIWHSTFHGDFRRGIDLFSEAVRKRYTKDRPCTPVIMRQHMGWRSILYRLKANIDIRQLPRKKSRPRAGTAANMRERVGNMNANSASV